MKLEDESLISAYLDQEIDAAERLQVESALESDPALKERLRSLAQVGEMVSSLPRPNSPIDLTAGVMTLVLQPATRFDMKRVYRASLWAATAASVLFVGILVFISDLRPRPDKGGAVVLKPETPTNSIAVQSDNGPSIPAPEIIHTVSTPPSAPKSKAAVADDRESPEERERLISLLARRDLHRVVIPIDNFGGASLDAVDDIVRTTGRKDADYARFTLAQGLVIDPKNPNKAEIFVVVVDEAERNLLLKSLKAAVPDLKAEEVVDNGIVGSLAEAGRVAFLPGQRAAGLIENPQLDRFAHKAHPGPTANSVSVDIRGNHVTPSPTLAPGQVEPVDGPAIVVDNDPGKPSEAKPESSPDRRFTLVLWVTSGKPSD